MSQIISRVSEPVRRKGAERYLQLTLLSFAASVSLTRFILMLTGYPQLGDETYHIAHVLYGGIFLYVGSLLPLIYANRWAYTWSSIFSGVGVGLFIDEVGKFITQSNDYFFPSAAPIIYAFFLTSVVIYNRVTKERPMDTRTEFYAVLETMEEIIDHDMSPDELLELRSRLGRIIDKETETDLSLLSKNILEFINSGSIRIVPDEPGLFDKIIDWYEGLEDRWVSRGRIRWFIIIGISIMGLAATFRLYDFLTNLADPILIETLLRERVSKLPIVTSASLFWAAVQLLMEGLVGLLLLVSTLLLIMGKERLGIGLGSTALLVSLVGVNLIQFYIDQFATILKAIIQFMILQSIYYYQRRFNFK